MCPRDRAEHADQHHQHRAGGERVAEQGQGDIAARQPLAHDAGADHRRQQQRRAERLRRKPLCPHATRGFLDVDPSTRPMSCSLVVSARRFNDATGRLTSRETRFFR